MKKNMKKLLVIVMALMPSLSILAMNPSGFSIVPDPDEIPIVPPSNPTPRPRQDIDPNLIPIKPAPSPGTGHEPRFRSSVQDPQCYHYDGVVSIYADSTVTFITATITRIGDGLLWSGSASTNTLSISVSSAIGVYRLELTLSDGRSFIGEYIIE